MNQNQKNNSSYHDIIDLPHHVSDHHETMTIHDRAAQFSPFAALTGFDSAIKETSRLTDNRMELDESAKSVLDEKLRMIQEQLPNQPEIELTFFQSDTKKEGGSYHSIQGVVKKIDGYEGFLILQDGHRIPIIDIIEITGEIFQSMEVFFP